MLENKEVVVENEQLDEFDDLEFDQEMLSDYLAMAHRC
jgi:hypothetical protein